MNESRRNFLRGLSMAPLAAVATTQAKPAPQPPKTIVVTNTVYKEMPENLNNADAVVWLKVLEERRQREWIAKQSAENFY
jgi:hypothetical protein